jgi:hypothetical protein
MSEPISQRNEPLRRSRAAKRRVDAFFFIRSVKKSAVRLFRVIAGNELDLKES